MWPEVEKVSVGGALDYPGPCRHPGFGLAGPATAQSVDPHRTVLAIRARPARNKWWPFQVFHIIPGWHGFGCAGPVHMLMRVWRLTERWSPGDLNVVPPGMCRPCEIRLEN